MSEQHWTRSRALWIGGAAVVLTLLIVGGTLVHRQLDAMNRNVRALEERVVELARQAESAREDAAVAADSAEEARQRAVQAEESAAVAARQRRQADSERAAAEERGRRQRELAKEARREAAAARQEAERIRAAREAELQRLQETLNRIADTRRSAMGLVMNLGEDQIRFEFDRAELGGEERELLSRIVGVLQTFDGYRIQVFGHTDHIGTVEYNRELSERRARAVRDYMVEAGIDPDLIATRGYGKSRPLVEGATPEARAANRRVEIGIIDTVVDYRGEPAGEEGQTGPDGQDRPEEDGLP